MFFFGKRPSENIKDYKESHFIPTVSSLFMKSTFNNGFYDIL